jgi:hypothetical protein
VAAAHEIPQELAENAVHLTGLVSGIALLYLLKVTLGG